MKFEKIIIPPGWKDTFTKYPNGRTIFEALSHTITTVNEGIEEVNQKVNQGLLAIEQAENTIRQEITESFNTLQLQLEGEVDDLSNDLIADFALLQSQVLTLISGKANAADVYTKQQVDAQLADVYTKQQVDAQLAEIENDKAEKTDVGLLSGLLTTAKTSIIAAINELFNNKANKAEAWQIPTLLNGWGSISAHPVKYRKNSNGDLEIIGQAINKITNSAQIFVLPVGYRANRNLNVATIYGDTFGRLYITTNGSVEIYNAVINKRIDFDVVQVALNN